MTRCLLQVVMSIPRPRGQTPSLLNTTMYVGRMSTKNVVWKTGDLDLSRSGFMETVSFGVEWLSEDKFRMIYDDKDDELDEEYFITIPE